MKATAALLVILIGAAVDAQPAEAMRLAHADAAKLPETVRPFVRYISLHNLTEKERAQFRPVLWGHCNQLSRSSILTRPVSVGPSMLRVNLKDYGWTPATWEKMKDPYFSVVTYAEHGKGYYKGSEWVWTEKHVRKESSFAPWLVESEEDRARIKELFNWTGGSYAPVVRGDWFFNQGAGSSKDRDAPYFDWFDAKTEDDIFKVIGFNRKLAEDFSFELLESIGDSGVAKSRIRGVERQSALGGGVWKTWDVTVETLKRVGDKANPLKTLGRELASHADGFEGIGLLPNGMQIFWQANRERKLVDVVPSNIASCKLLRGNDTEIQSYAVCYVCHTKQGLQDLDGWARNALNPPLALKLYDYDKAIELRQQYLRKLEPKLKLDRDTFEEAAFEATGLKGNEYISRLTAFWFFYEDRMVTPELAAADLGMTKEEFQRRLLLAIKGGYDVPLDLGALVHEGKRARALPVRVWEQVIPVAYAAMKFSEKRK